MISRIRQYPTESMGILFASVFFIFALVASFLAPVDNVVTIPLVVSIPVFIILLSGLIMIYKSSGQSSLDELFVMMSVMCASLSDGFWIFMLLAVIVLLIRRRKVLNFNNSLFKLWGVLVICSMISAFFATDSQGLAFGAAFGILVYALIFVAVAHEDYTQIHGEEFLQRIGVLLSFSIVTAVLFSLWHLFFFSHYISVLIFKFQPSTGYGDSFGMASIYGEWPTHSSAFLVMSLWVLVGIFTYSKLTKSRKIIILSGIVASFVGVLATLSRNAFLFLAVSLGVMFLVVLFKPMYRKFIVWLVGIGVILSGTLLYFLSHFSKWRDLLSNPWKQATIAERLEQYRLGLEYVMQSENKLFGIGLMNFAPMARRITGNPNIADYLHQLPLSFLLEIGIVGLGIFIILLILIGKRIFQNNKSDIFKIVFISWLFMGMFDNWLYFMWSSTLFIVIVAVGSRTQQGRE